ncbi:hypothetical protein [Mesorhizobium xinjiangense]|nr:hypothetical protein [Mesorhizobium xinjiangense]
MADTLIVGRAHSPFGTSQRDDTAELIEYEAMHLAGEPGDMERVI